MQVDIDVWRIVPGFEKYEISQDGRIRKKTTKRELTPVLDKDGYKKVGIRCADGSRRTCSIHRLVALTYIPNPESKPQVNHKNGIKGDCRVSNLEWVTSSENRKHAYDNNLQPLPHAKAVRCVETGTVYKSQAEAARSTGCWQANISRSIRRKYALNKGLHWEWA